MEYKTYKELSSKICENIFNVVYEAKPNSNGRLNLAKLSTDIFSEVMNVIDKVIK